MTHTRINLYGSSTCCTCTCYCFIPSDAPTLCGQVILKFSKEARLHVLVDLLSYILVTPSPSCLIQTCDAFIFSPLSKVAGVAMAKGQGVMVRSHPRRILPVHFRVDLSLRQVLIYSLNVAWIPILMIKFSHIYWLVVWNMICYDFPYIGKNNSNWRTHIFQRGGSTTNQSIVQVRETVLISRGDALVVTPLCAKCTLESESRAISIYFQQFELPLGTILSFNILYYDWFQEMYGYLIFKKKYEIRSGWWFQTFFSHIYWEH